LLLRGLDDRNLGEIDYKEFAQNVQPKAEEEIVHDHNTSKVDDQQGDDKEFAQNVQSSAMEEIEHDQNVSDVDGQQPTQTAQPNAASAKPRSRKILAGTQDATGIGQNTI